MFTRKGWGLVRERKRSGHARALALLCQRSGRTMHTTEMREPSSASVGQSLVRASAGFTVSATLLIILMVGLAAL